MTCAQYLTTHPQAQLDGFYGTHLSQYFSFYSPLQLYVIVYEDFQTEPLLSIQKLYDFLELDASCIPKRLEAYAPPPEEPKHRGRISRLLAFVVAQVKKDSPNRRPCRLCRQPLFILIILLPRSLRYLKIPLPLTQHSCHTYCIVTW